MFWIDCRDEIVIALVEVAGAARFGNIFKSVLLGEGERPYTSGLDLEIVGVV